MSDYFDREADKTYTRVYKKETPDILKAFVDFDEAVFASEGRAVPSHSKRAVAAGAAEQELAEAALVATAIRAGGGFARGRLAFTFGEAEHSH
ncbi:carboxymuconolactone decarboxylase family protein [Leifsonia aquatica]|uniref:carboxymuconolactone decarboxylase family protein n=1 Tax=Leifsonia aquatica TaxID=144185 RepID=UPI0028AA1D19|nr:carboxymuconolactone decarboxylase family protein [Leifsonia aquatica]